ncbi:MAG: hypothetical protein LBE04_02510 [Prevotellaceae bacterium]|jgi:glutamate 5-kinase|nr:hypothetical protein [Prevotellaceae bacterium]
METQEKLKYKRIVVKIGSNVLTCIDGTLDTERMSLLVDQIAKLFHADALMQPKATSLLPIGVESVEGNFEKDDIVQIVAPSGGNIGVGRVTMPVEKACQVIGKRGLKALIHYDYMYLE